MFQFPGSLCHGYFTHHGVISRSTARVSPFGILRVKAALTTPRSLSQFNHVFHRLLLPRYPPYTLSSF